MVQKFEGSNDANLICEMYAPVKTLPRAIKHALERLQKGVEVSKHCRERQHFHRCSKLALMHERNNYLRKLRIIEELGRRNEWHIRKTTQYSRSINHQRYGSYK